MSAWRCLYIFIVLLMVETHHTEGYQTTVTDLVPELLVLDPGQTETLSCPTNQSDCADTWCYVTKFGSKAFVMEKNNENNTVWINGSLECPGFNFEYNANNSLPACDEMLIYCICQENGCFDHYLQLLRRPFFIKLTEPTPEPCPSQTVEVCSTTTCQPEPSPTTSSINTEMTTTTADNTTPPTPSCSCPITTTSSCFGPTATVSNCPTPTLLSGNICKMPNLFHNVTDSCRAVLDVCCNSSSHPTTTMITTLVTTAMVVWWVIT